MEQRQEENNMPNQASFKNNLISVISPLIFVLVAVGLMLLLAHYRGI